MSEGSVTEVEKWRGKSHVLTDRSHAGRVLAGLLNEFRNTDSLIFAIPAGGVPVAAEIARELRLPLDVVIVSKITPPWNTEVGYGAVAFDGTVRINERLREGLGLSGTQAAEGVGQAKRKVERRAKRFGVKHHPADLQGKTVIVVDDGLASGLTMEVAVDVLRGRGAAMIVVAVPTGHGRALEALARKVDRIVCANVRGGAGFAVADAYERWNDVSEDETLSVLEQLSETGDRTPAFQSAP